MFTRICACSSRGAQPGKFGKGNVGGPCTCIGPIIYPLPPWDSELRIDGEKQSWTDDLKIAATLYAFASSVNKETAAHLISAAENIQRVVEKQLPEGWHIHLHED